MSRTGFTLLEMLIVVTILAIAAVLIVPRFVRSETTQLRAAARLLEADLNYARVESISHPDTLRLIKFDPPADRYHLATAADAANPITNPATQTPYEVTFGHGRAGQLAGVAIDAISVGGDQTLGFGQYGELDQPEPATIRLACDGHHVTVTLDPTTGEISVGDLQ